ncbi:MAG TPA: hypothetical protein VGR53_04275 [Nitrososphaerales archaeon]|nr:hypothetical protein [Nitrososphaerales archaeon]
MKWAATFVVMASLLAITIVATFAQSSTFYLTSQLSPIRVNPDGTYYPGDRFQVTVYPHVQLVGGDSLVGITYSWSYDSGAFSASGTSTSEVFAIFPNAAPGTYTITISATATFVYYVNGTAYYFTETSSTSQSMTVIEFVLNLDSRLDSRLVNMTDSNGCVARNPDGTFYRGDRFGISYNATFRWQKQRTDIGIATTIQYNRTAFYEYGQNTTKFLFNVTKDAFPRVYDFVLNATATNSYGERIGTNASIMHVSVVAYRPMFTFTTYVDYNNLNSSAYRRPFVTLVRYGGNRPNYSSPGGQTWDAFAAANSTGERALIDNFTFSTAGWRVHANFVSSNVTQDVAYWPNMGLDLHLGTLNKTLSSCEQVFAWSNRVQKYYFSADWKRILNYTSKGITYFNTTLTAWSRDFPYTGDNLRLFNTSHLHEPVYYNGLLIFRTYNGLGRPDPSVSNVTIRVFNPSPLNQFLLSQFKARFGSDPSVERAFKRDLYAANSSMILRPYQEKNGEWYFLVNQTNIAMAANASLPIYTISVIGNTTGMSTYSFAPDFPYANYAGQSGRVLAYNFTYRTVGPFSTIVVSNKSFTPAPFTDFTGYYVDPRGSLVALPMNFTYPANFTYGGAMSYLLWSNNKSTPFYITTTVPGQMSKEYAMSWGQNVTVPVCISGCLFGLASPPQVIGASAFQINPVIGQMTAGATQVWVKNDQGVLLDNESLPSTYPPIGTFAPPGFIGLHTLEFNVPSGSSSISLFVRNSWGAVAELDGIPISTLAPTSLTGGGLVLILTVIGLLAIGFLLLGGRTRPPNQSTIY